MSFKNKKKRKKIDLFGKRDKLQEAEFLVNGERFGEAIVFLNDLVEKYPDDFRFWEMLAIAATQKYDLVTMQRACLRLTQIQPDNMDASIGLARSYELDDRIGLAYQAYEDAVYRFQNREGSKSIPVLRDAAGKRVRRLCEDFGFDFDGDGVKLLCLHEKVQVLMNQQELDEAVSCARQLLKKRPDFFPAINNLSLTLYMKGEIEAAASNAQKTLEIMPDNFHALSNLIRFSVFLGKQNEAKEFAKKLKRIKSENPDIYLKKIEAFSFLGDDQAVVETFKECKNTKSGYATLPNISKHLAAFAFYHLGDKNKAKKLWEEIVEDEIDFDCAELNLEQMELPEYERDIFGLRLQDWIPKGYLEKFLRIVSKVKSGRNFDRKLRISVSEFVKENQNILNIFPIMFERSDFAAKEFAVKLLEWAETPEALKLLEDFAFSNTGSDKIRYSAATVLSRLDVISNNVKMWQGGKLKELHLMCYRISGDVPEIYPLKPKAENFLRKGVIAMQESNFELAEQYYRMALDANGEHPSILYNLLVLKQIDGSVKDAEKKLKDIIKKFPEYTFARIQLATQYARQGDVEKAKKLVERFQNKKEWHFGEINTWFSYNIELAITEEKFDIARNNLEILSEISEDFDFEYWDDYILRMERGAKFAPVVEMAEMEKKLHSGKKKRSR